MFFFFNLAIDSAIIGQCIQYKDIQYLDEIESSITEICTFFNKQQRNFSAFTVGIHNLYLYVDECNTCVLSDIFHFIR